MIDYVDSRQKWNYIQRKLKPYEIDYSKIAIDDSVYLSLEWFEKYRVNLDFAVLVTAISMRFNWQTAHEYLVKNISKKTILENIDLFCHKDFVKYIKNIDLLNMFHINLKDTESIIIAAFLLGNGNLNDKNIVKSVYVSGEPATIKLFETHVQDKYYLEKLKHELSKEIINKNVKGDLKCKTWRGLKNIVLEKLKNLSSLANRFKAQLINGIKKAR